MEHDYTLDELLVMLRVTTRVLSCTNNGMHDWCEAHDSCIKCKLDIIDAIERKAAEEWQRGYDEGFASADDWCAAMTRASPAPMTGARSTRTRWRSTGGIGRWTLTASLYDSKRQWRELTSTTRSRRSLAG